MPIFYHKTVYYVPSLLFTMLLLYTSPRPPACCVFNRLRNKTQSSLACAAGGYFLVRESNQSAPKGSALMESRGGDNVGYGSVMNDVVRIRLCGIPKP